MSNIWGGVVAVLMAIIGIAILSVLVSKNSNTVGVLGAGSNAFSNALSTAMSPITGANVNTFAMGGTNQYGFTI